MIDITHGIAPHNVVQGALVLASTIPFMPEGIHLAVVDPGVGSDRKAIALRGSDGRVYVGPDNGLARRSRPTGSAESRRRWSSQIPPTDSSRSPTPSTAATSSRRPRLTWLRESSWARWGRPSTAQSSCA